ncbi:O-methyltransferase [Bacteroidia bacterium]|nr:O-methyltransferase [Bacteroidia bacterium]
MDVEHHIEQYMEQYSEPEPPILADLRRKTNLTMLRARMLSGHLQGQFLKMICQIACVRRVLEIGTYTGYSAIAMAAALPVGGLLYTIDNNDELEDIVREYVEKSGFKDKIRFVMGDALEVIPSLEEEFDIVFMDADKRQYSDYYRLVFDKVRSGGLLIVDDVLWDGKVLNDEGIDGYQDAKTQGIIAFNEMLKQDDRVEKLMLPLRHGIYMIRKK